MWYGWIHCFYESLSKRRTWVSDGSTTNLSDEPDDDNNDSWGDAWDTRFELAGDDDSAPANARFEKLATLFDNLSQEGSTTTIGSDNSLVLKDELPPRIERFVVHEELGRGGYGVVYRAYDPVLDRDVAMKVIRPRRKPGDDNRVRLREARASAKMSHPYLVPLHEVLDMDECVYLVSEYCPGSTLTQLIEEYPNGMPVKWAAEIAACVAQAIAHAHHRGFVHRDIKPSNILLVPDSVANDAVPFIPRLTDFGLVHDLFDQVRSREGQRLVGTLCYIAPEQLVGGKELVGATDVQVQVSDIYSLGVVLHQMLVGKIPFRASRTSKLLEIMATTEPAALRDKRPEVDRDLEAICLKCLKRLPHERYASAQDLVDDLKRHSQQQPVAARPRSRQENAWNLIRRTPFESTLILGLITMSVLAAAIFAGSNRSLRQHSRWLAAATDTAKHNETLAKLAESRAQEALLDVEHQRQKAEQSGEAALQLAIQSDLRQAFSAVLAGDSANSMLIADQILDYAGPERVQDRLDWKLLKTVAHRGWRRLPLGLEEAQPSPMNEVAAIPGQGRVVSATEDGFVRIHDSKTGTLIHSLPHVTPKALTDPSSLSEYGWQLSTNILGYKEQVQCHALAVSPDGRWLAVGKSISASFLSWQATNFVELVDLSTAASGDLSVDHTIGGFNSTVESLTFSKDGKKLLVGPRYEPIQVIEMDDHQQRTFHPSIKPNRQLLLTSDGDLVYLPSGNQFARVGITSNHDLQIWTIDQNWSCRTAAALGAGKLILYVPTDSDRVYLIKSGEANTELYYFVCERGVITQILLTQDEQHLVVGTAGGGIGIWDMKECLAAALPESIVEPARDAKRRVQPRQYHVRHQGAVRCLALDEEGRVYSGGDGGVLAVADLFQDPRATKGERLLASHHSSFDSEKRSRKMEELASKYHVFSPDSKYLYRMISNEGIVRQRLSDLSIEELLPRQPSDGCYLRMLPDHPWLIAGYRDGSVILQHVSDPARRVILPGDPEMSRVAKPISHVQFSPSLNRMAICHAKYHVHLFAVAFDDDQSVPTVQAESRLALRRTADAVFFRNDDTLLLYGDKLASYRIGDAMEHEIAGGKNNIASTWVDSAGKRILLGCFGGHLHSLSESGEVLLSGRQWRSEAYADGRYHDITCMTLSDDRKTLLTGGTTGELGIWNAETLRHIGTVIPSTDRRNVTSIAIAPNGSMIVYYVAPPNSVGTFHVLHVHQDDARPNDSQLDTALNEALALPLAEVR